MNFIKWFAIGVMLNTAKETPIYLDKGISFIVSGDLQDVYCVKEIDLS